MSHKIVIDDTEFLRLWTEGYSNEEIQEALKISPTFCKRKAKQLGLRRSPQEIVAVRKREMIRRYGADNPMAVPEFAEKQARTNIEKYGATSFFGSPEKREEIKNIWREKYGVDNPGQMADHKEKIEATSLQKYGVSHVMFSDEIKERARQTCQEKYGGNGPMCSVEVREKSRQTVQRKYGVDNISKVPSVVQKSQNTMKERYGHSHALQVPEFQEKRTQTCIERYGASGFEKGTAGEERKINGYNQKYQQLYGETDIIITNRSQLNISPEVYNIINDADRLRQALEETEGSSVMLAEKLGIGLSALDKRIAAFNLYDSLKMWVSKTEIEIRNLIESWGIKTEHNRKAIYPYEIDIFCPEYNMGIEFNGNWWHCEYKKDKKYHQTKYLMAQGKGIFLYQIFEYEWNDEKTRDKIIAQLQNLFGKNESKVYARECVAKAVPTKEAQEFLRTNHLQGADKSCLKLGLYHNDELVSLLTMCRPRFNKKYDWELSRFCCKRGTSVVGGASKLFGVALQQCPGTIISYSNNAKTKGGIYKLLGFSWMGDSEPNYVWNDGSKKVLSRYQTQMKNEVEIMHERKYFRIFDAGNKIWVYERRE